MGRTDTGELQEIADARRPPARAGAYGIDAPGPDKPVSVVRALHRRDGHAVRYARVREKIVFDVDADVGRRAAGRIEKDQVAEPELIPLNVLPFLELIGGRARDLPPRRVFVHDRRECGAVHPLRACAAVFIRNPEKPDTISRRTLSLFSPYGSGASSAGRDLTAGATRDRIFATSTRRSSSRISSSLIRGASRASSASAVRNRGARRRAAAQDQQRRAGQGRPLTQALRHGATWPCALTRGTREAVCSATHDAAGGSPSP